jgi:hypothetical protein
MSTIVRYEPITGRIMDHMTGANAADWTGKPNTLIDPDDSAVSGLPVREWRVDIATMTLRQATAEELSGDLLRDLEISRAAVRESAVKSVLGGATGDHVAVLFRALLRVMAQEFARVKAGQAPRTAPELWAAVRAVIQAGQADADL